jgi:uncharacterized membrane protein YfcA
VDATLLLSLALSAGVGVSLGVFGGGGSILAVPILVYVTHIAPSAAIGMSLSIVGATSLTASYAHHRKGRVRPRVALLFGGAGVATAFLAARFTHLVTGAALMISFATLMLVVGIAMFASAPKANAGEGDGPLRSPKLIPAVLAGAGVGAITGFLGVGGGFLVVPALIAFTGLGMREAVGTSLLVIAINSTAGFLGHLGADRLNLQLVVPFTIAAVIGGAIGERVACSLSLNKLRRGFALFVIAVGVAVAGLALTGPAL